MRSTVGGGHAGAVDGSPTRAYSSNRRSFEHEFDHGAGQGSEEGTVRRYDEHVQVRVAPPQDGAPARPDAFIWRDRLYVVTEVLATWLEREAWWEVDVRRGEPAPYERTVWRVEAGPGRWAGTGVYDLAQTVPVMRPHPVLAGATATGGTAPDGPALPAPAPDAEWWLLCRLD
jgi:hypothetical protein